MVNHLNRPYIIVCFNDPNHRLTFSHGFYASREEERACTCSHRQTVAKHQLKVDIKEKSPVKYSFFSVCQLIHNNYRQGENIFCSGQTLIYSVHKSYN